MTSSLRLALLWDPTPTDPRIITFVEQAIGTKADRYNEYEWEYLQNAIYELFSINRALPLAPEVFEAILIPLIRGNSGHPIMMVRGLRHPNCPESVLAAACHSSIESVRRVAAMHPNCSEEDAVYAALVNLMEPK